MRFCRFNLCDAETRQNQNRNKKKERLKTFWDRFERNTSRKVFSGVLRWMRMALTLCIELTRFSQKRKKTARDPFLSVYSVAGFDYFIFGCREQPSAPAAQTGEVVEMQSTQVLHLDIFPIRRPTQTPSRPRVLPTGLSLPGCRGAP